MEGILDFLDYLVEPFFGLVDVTENISILDFGFFLKASNSLIDIILINPGLGDKLSKLGVSLPGHFIVDLAGVACIHSLHLELDKCRCVVRVAPHQVSHTLMLEVCYNLNVGVCFVQTHFNRTLYPSVLMSIGPPVN